MAAALPLKTESRLLGEICRTSRDATATAVVAAAAVHSADTQIPKFQSFLTHVFYIMAVV